MKLGIVVPWRATEDRILLFRAVDRRRQLLHPDVPIYRTNSVGKTFNPSEARNRGCIKAFNDGCDIVAVLDADTMFEASCIEDGIKYIKENGGVCYAYTMSAALDLIETEKVTKSIRYDPFTADRELDMPWEPEHVGSGWILDKSGFDTMGGWDEHCRGWGYEDTTFEAAYKKLYGQDLYRATGNCVRLFHRNRDMEHVAGNQVRFHLYDRSSKEEVEQLVLDNMIHLREQDTND